MLRRREPPDPWPWLCAVLAAAYFAVHLGMLGRSFVEWGGILTALVFGR